MAIIPFSQGPSQQPDQKSSDANYSMLLDSIEQGVVLAELVVDQQGQAFDLLYLKANKVFEQQLGMGDVVGKTLFGLIPNADRQWLDFYTKVLLTGKPARGQYYMELIRRWFTVFASRVGGTQSRQLAIVFDDITDRKRAEDDLGQREAQLQQNEERNAFMLKLSDAIRPLEDPVQTQATAVQILGEHLGANQVHYGETVGDDVVIHQGYGYGLPAMVGRFRSVDFGEKLTATHRAGKVQVINNVEEDPTITETEVQVLRAASIGAYITVPLIKKGNWVATLAVHSIKARVWTSQEIELVKETAERTWAAVERARSEQALRDADRRKDEFMAMLGHELRNPLAVLSNTLTVLELTQCQDVSLSFPLATERMERQVKHLCRMVDDLLEVSRIQQGKIRLLSKPVDMGLLVSQTLEAFGLMSQDLNRFIEKSLPSYPCMVNGDATRLSQVVMNLLGNAAKYTNEGGHIQVMLDQHAEKAVLQVKDDGIGIPADELSVIFEVFVQGRTSLDRPHGGLGLGLAVVRQIIEGHKGHIECRSAGPGQGSEFIIELPLLMQEPGLPKPLEEKIEVRDAVRVLIVDDNQELIDLMGKTMQLQGYEVHLRYSGQEGIAAAETLEPDVILLDIGMPNLDGYAVCQHIRRQPWSQNMAIVALTGYGREADKQRSWAAGFDDHLLKPIDYSTLSEMLTQVISTKKQVGAISH